MNPRILVFAGSIRRDSLNRRLARLAAEAADAAGGQATLLELAEYPLPFYDGDLEVRDGPPENAFRLQALIAAQDGLIIVSPEYNHSIPALLKNTLDWVSRTPRVRGPNPFAGKVAGLMSASPGGLGGLQGLDQLRRVVEAVGTLVLPRVMALPHADHAFDAEGGLKEGSMAKRVAELAAEVVATAGKLRA